MKPPNFNIDVDINDFHCSFGHVHEGLLRETAKQRNVNLTGTLQECEGCSIAKGRAKPIPTTTRTRAGVGGEDKKPQSSDPRRWSLLEWSPTQVGRTHKNKRLDKLGYNSIYLLRRATTRDSRDLEPPTHL